MKGSSMSGLRSGSSGFVCGQRLDSGQVYATKARSIHELARVGTTCTLQTKKASGQQHQGDIPLESKALVVTSQEAMLRAAMALKPLSKQQKFLAAMRRVWTAPHLGVALANAAETVLTLLDSETKPYYADLEIQLVDNFAPVTRECPPTPCLEVTGTIPECMNGVYVRNGSNPQFMPIAGYHVFDGDGMLHAVRIKDGVPSYCCRFTRTSRYVQEKATGHTLYVNALGELTGLLGLGRLSLFYFRDRIGIVDKSKGVGTANAGLVFYNGRLLAMSEDDMPYAIAISPEDGDVRTLGRYNISGKLTRPMTAHPKVDPITGELFSYSYNVLTKPYLQYFRVSAQGEMNTPPVAIHVKEPILPHDFAVTEKYAVIPDPMMVFRLSEMFAGRTSVVMDEKKVPQFGVLPKYATDESQIRWFQAPGLSCFHYVNAWEEGDELVLIGSNNTPLSKVFNDPSKLLCYVTECRMNLKTGKTNQRRVSEMNLDIGRMNEKYSGRKNRYVYFSMSGPWPKFSGIVKLDLEASSAGSHAEVGVRKFAPGCYCSEPFFVARSNDADTAEDDGFLVSYLHNESTNVSELGIFDARSPTLEPVAIIKLPSRVPYGFHGIFLSEEQLANQNSSPL